MLEQAQKFNEEVLLLLNYFVGFCGTRDELPSDSQAVDSHCRLAAVISTDQY